MVPAIAVAESTHGGFTDVTRAAGLTHVQRRDADIGDGTAVNGAVLAGAEGIVSAEARQVYDQSHHFSGGGAVGDFFNNGWQDLYLTRNDNTDILYKNMGDGTFQDVTEQVFVGELVSDATSGAMFADVNNDGHLDLYVTTNGGRRHYLYINDGHNRLVEQAEERGVMQLEPPDVERNAGMSVTAGDFTGNGFLDLYVADWRPRDRERGDPPRNRLYRNSGNSAPGYFEDVTIQAGLDTPSNQTGFAARFADMNRDGHLDLLATNDFLNSQYYENKGDGTFTERSTEMGTGTGVNEMGSAVADYNNNGWLDWFVTAIDTNLGNRLYRNEMHRGWEGIYFTDQTDAGVRNGHWGWGASFIDYDNDGLRDLVMVNGYFDSPHDHAPMKFWRNEGPDNGYRFTDIGAEIGLDDRGQGRGLIVADFFNNGFLDILVINYADEPVLYRNEGGTNSWLRIETIGVESNRMGIGALITVRPDLDSMHQLVHEVNLGANFLSHNETIAHFGLGDRQESVDYIHVRWPSGIDQEFHNVHVNQQITIHEVDGMIEQRPTSRAERE